MGKFDRRSLGGLALGRLLLWQAVLMMMVASAAAGAPETAPGAPRTSFALPEPRSRHGRRDVDGGGTGGRRVARQAAAGYSQDEVQAMLNAHLDYRRNVTPPAADMNLISWDDELATLARDWAAGCSFEHGFPSVPTVFNGLVAQNIWMGSLSFGLTDAVTAWYNEYMDYDYATESCSAVCGHYRVMVFSEVQIIGCGSATCQNGQQRLTVCNYGPSIGTKGKPYKVGPACGLCASGRGWCDDKLCNPGCEEEGSECSCKLNCLNCGELDKSGCMCTCKAGWQGTDCSEPCVDNKDYCNSGAYTPEGCAPDPGAQKDCPATCELCGVVDELTPPMDRCCDGKACDAGKVLDEKSCECISYLKAAKIDGSGAGPLTAGWSCTLTLAALASLRGVFT